MIDLDLMLRRAAENGDLEAVRALLVRGASPDAVGTDGRNAIDRARDAGHDRVLAALSEAGDAVPGPARARRRARPWARPVSGPSHQPGLRYAPPVRWAGFVSGMLLALTCLVISGILAAAGIADGGLEPSSWAVMVGSALSGLALAWWAGHTTAPGRTISITGTGIRRTTMGITVRYPWRRIVAVGWCRDAEVNGFGRFLQVYYSSTREACRPRLNRDRVVVPWTRWLLLEITGAEEAMIEAIAVHSAKYEVLIEPGVLDVLPK